MTGENRRKVRNYLVNKDLQLRVIFYSLVFMVIVVIATVTVIVFPLIRDMMLSENLDVQYRAAQSFVVISSRLIPAMIILFVLYALHLVLLTHRICGPFVNFAHTFKRMKQGDLTRKVFLRKHDYFKDESHSVNIMIDELSKIVSRLLSDQEHVMSELEDVIGRVDTLDTGEKARSSLERVKTRAQRVSEDLELFKLE